MSSTTIVSSCPTSRSATPVPQQQRDAQSASNTWAGMARDTATFVARSAGPAMVVAAVGAVVEHEFHVVEQVRDYFDPHHDRGFASNHAPEGGHVRALNAPNVRVVHANLNADSRPILPDLPPERLCQPPLSQLIPHHVIHPEIAPEGGHVRALGEGLRPGGPFIVALHPGTLRPPEAPWPVIAPPQGPPPAAAPGTFTRFNENMVVAGWGGVGALVGNGICPVFGGAVGGIVGAGVGFLWNEIF